MFMLYVIQEMVKYFILVKVKTIEYLIIFMKLSNATKNIS